MLNDYDALAPEYQKTDTKPDKQFSILPTVMRMAGDLEGKTVLDVGCGAGFFSNAFANAGAKHVLGIDSSEVQVALAKKVSRPNLEFRVADATSTALPPSDVICVPFVLNYFSETESLKTFLRNIRQALLPGGVVLFVLDVPSEKDLQKFGARKIVHGPLRDGTPTTLELYNAQGFLICELQTFFLSLTTFETCLRECGFRSIERYSPIISEAGLKEMGESFWNGYLDDTQLAYYRCQ